MSELHTAALQDNLNLVKRLIKEGYDVNQQDEEGCTPLFLAAANGHLEVVQELTRLPSCVYDMRNCEGRTPLMEAAEKGHIDTVQYLANFCEVNVTDHHGYSALMEAVSHHDSTIAKLLIDYGASVNIRDSRGRTALHMGALFGQAMLIRNLIHGGAEINAQDYDGYTPLYISCWDPWEKQNSNSLECMEILLQAGADLNIPDSVGCLPVERVWGNQRKVLELINYGCEVNCSLKHGYGLLHMAAMTDDDVIIRALHLTGCTINRAKLLEQWKNTKHENAFLRVIDIFSETLTLKCLCRIQIRKVLGNPLYTKTQLLPIPTAIKSFILNLQPT